MVKVKAHRGEPLKEKADTQAENARQLQDDCRQWTVRTPSMTYEWSDSNGVKQTTAWSKALHSKLESFFPVLMQLLSSARLPANRYVKAI